MKRPLGALALAVLLVACSRKSAPTAGVTETTAATLDAEDAGFTSAAEALGGEGEAAPRAVRTEAAPTRPGERVSIPAGSFSVGSAPGDEGRVATSEATLEPIALGPFAIDALPFPNDPSAPPVLAGDADEAAAHCAGRGARLCTELEWERACKGPDGDRFVSGGAWDERCSTAPSRCASGFGVRAMGFMRELTGSRFGEGGPPVVRGGPAGARRCAARTPAGSKASGPYAFRCCEGAPNDAAMPRPRETKLGFQKADLEASDLERIFAEVPELARIASGVRLFGESDVEAVVSRSSASADGIKLVTTPILWGPEPGVELLVATGRAKPASGGKTSFVVALWTMPGEGKPRYRFASSFLFLNESAPVVLAYEPSRRKELRWTTCWGCAGEQGAVTLRDDGRVVIVQY